MSPDVSSAERRMGHMPARSSVLTPEKGARHMFGFRMRMMREEADMSLVALGKVINYGQSTVARVERAQQVIPRGMPPALNAAFNTEVFTDLYVLARKENHPPKFRERMEYETEATIIQEYASCVIPGLVQTEAYSRAQFEAANPRAPRQHIDDLVQARVDRRALITQSEAPDLWLLLDEAVLRRPFGGRATMRGQLADLLEVAALPTVTMQVVPYDLGAHALIGGNLTLFTLKNGKQVAWEESATTGTLIEESSLVLDRVRGYDQLRASAPSPKQSADIVKAVMEAL